MVIVIGEILMDIFPEYERLGGAPFNFAYHLAQMGVHLSFVSRVGADRTGKEILKRLDERGFDTRMIQTDLKYPTGRVEVTPDDSGEHTFYIIENVAYDRIELPKEPGTLAGGDPVELIYFGTLAQRTPGQMARIQRFLASKDENTIAFYDVNLRPDTYTKETIRASLGRTDFLKLNLAELELLGEMFAPGVARKDLAGYFMKQFHIRDMAVTRGDAGSDLIREDGRRTTGVPEIAEIKDTVGAGDAYAAMLAIGYLNRWTPERIIETASEFSARICTIAGAIPDDPSFYEPYRRMMGDESNA